LRKVCVTGAAGFIGHWLVRYLKDRGYWVRAVDIKQPEFSPLDEADENWWGCDLRVRENALAAVMGCNEVYGLAATMGGMGFVGAGDSDFEIMTDNAQINLNTLSAALRAGVERYLYTSSACVYPERLQEEVDAKDLKESDAWKGKPDTAYGVEKLFTETFCQVINETTDMKVRIARFHNIYGPEGTWRGGREKAPAALCRKVAEAKLHGVHKVNVWGDGEQTRSFCYIDDCLESLYRLMRSGYEGPLNVGTDRAVTINGLVDTIADHAGIEVEKDHDLSKPQGVRGRNADLSKMVEVLDYEPRVTLEDGIGRLYDWVEEQVRTHA
jgi:nucleoside-diphosphate-sugar epimerase